MLQNMQIRLLAMLVGFVGVRFAWWLYVTVRDNKYAQWIFYTLLSLGVGWYLYEPLLERPALTQQVLQAADALIGMGQSVAKEVTLYVGVYLANKTLGIT